MHGAALTWGILWLLFCIISAIYVVTTIGGDMQSLPLTAGWFMAFMTPPVALEGVALRILFKKPKLL